MHNNKMIKKRIKGTKSIWVPLKKVKIVTFKDLGKSIKKRVGDKVIQLKEEKTLLSRFLITARKSPELDLEHCIGNFEFSVVPKALFSADGIPLACLDKLKLIHGIEELASKGQTTNGLSGEVETNKVIIIDGMAVVNQTPKTPAVKTCKDFASAFTERVLQISRGCDEIRLVFDCYIENSLKARTRKHRTSVNEVRYKVSDNSNISSISLKQFLSHIDTKQALTIYLAKKVMEALSSLHIRYIVTYDTKMESNFVDCRIHDHEEADTALIYNAMDVAQQSPLTSCIVYSPDTDVFLLLIYYYEMLPINTIFRTGRVSTLRDIDIRNCFEALGAVHAKAILGFHTFTGCDQTGRFNKKSKSAWLKIYLQADNEVVLALSTLGSTVELPNLETLESLERFVVSMYKGNKCPADVVSLSQLRWNLFSKFQCDADMLPPTLAALKYKIFRCHFISMVLRSSHILIQQLPNAVNYGWDTDEVGNLSPIMTDELPAPLALIELSSCNCKTSCISN
ncbi:uncharacterized protein LOC130631667 [Hydractinia symbiolongicarpus]|uniref:uncharacterized protein LOC130631667 n=1 Tax=Hydractinia symbiolongicarpus TaxID=13093 RepID=UPI0025513F55|nr:uncharacterized protein LOC130631667 [Hydractinia symbiolongicarpus]